MRRTGEGDTQFEASSCVAISFLFQVVGPGGQVIPRQDGQRWWDQRGDLRLRVAISASETVDYLAKWRELSTIV